MTITKLQRQVAAWHWARFGFDCEPWAVALKLAEESGEACRAVVEQTYPTLNGERDAPDLADELVDVLVSVCALASRSTIDLHDAIERRWPTIQARRNA